MYKLSLWVKSSEATSEQFVKHSRNLTANKHAIYTQIPQIFHAIDSKNSTKIPLESNEKLVVL